MHKRIQKSITNEDHEACPGEHAGIFEVGAKILRKIFCSH